MAREHAGVVNDAEADDFLRERVPIGDLLVLADEAPAPLPRAQALADAAAVLTHAGEHRLAAETLVRASDLCREARAPAPDTAQLRALLAGIEQELKSSAPRVTAWPREVLLFTGHMMDAPGRGEPRFPPALEPVAVRELGTALDALGAGPPDLALCQAAAGGDLLFLEACQRRSVRCQVLLPFDKPAFIERSVRPSTRGEQWVARFDAVTAGLRDPVRVMPDILGPGPEGIDSFERCNLWLLYTALACGPDRVRLVALWNGGGGDGPGGTRHLHDEVKRRSGQVTWLDARRWQAP